MIIDYVDGKLVIDGEGRMVFGNDQNPAITVTLAACECGTPLVVTRHYMVGVPSDLRGRLRAAWMAARSAWAIGAATPRQ